MAVTYTTAQIDTIVATLEAALGAGTVEVLFQGRKITYRSVIEIRNAIAYFKSLYSTASDAPAVPTPKIRTFLLFGGKGF